MTAPFPFRPAFPTMGLCPKGACMLMGSCWNSSNAAQETHVQILQYMHSDALSACALELAPSTRTAVAAAVLKFAKAVVQTSWCLLSSIYQAVDCDVRCFLTVNKLFMPGTMPQHQWQCLELLSWIYCYHYFRSTCLSSRHTMSANVNCVLAGAIIAALLQHSHLFA
ncbi:hypothetical protein COO60DRAFT_1009368 [Scenedesmus sp. NREL 46B-D3]|nr:hypothetical protein COO60DRAFT_1009368 [Scenedesmus sp. NREL 46B-D3]